MLAKPKQNTNGTSGKVSLMRQPMKDVPKPLKDMIQGLYASGLSTRQVGTKTGVSKSCVHTLVFGLTRTSSEANILRQPTTSKHWRSSRQAAVKAWLRSGRQIPPGFDIHHIDRDYTNNSLDNLACVDHREHGRFHGQRTSHVR